MKPNDDFLSKYLDDVRDEMKRRRDLEFRLLLGVLILLACFPPGSLTRAAGVRYATPAAVGSGDCSSWANACPLQTALAGAQSGDEIWVKAGVHKPAPAGERGTSFALRLSVPLYGGFAGTESAREQRNWETNRTILSGDIDGNDLNADGNFIAETWTDIAGENAYHVVLSDYMTATAPTLDGFIITAGQAVEANGGGIYNNATEMTLNHLIFSGNLATGEGSGAGQGGAICNLIGTLTAANTRFTGNHAYSGGGLYIVNAGAALVKVTFTDNSATQGGGVSNNFFYAPATITYTDVTFSGNTASYNGGGMANLSSSPTLTNVRFDQNSATNHGGGMISDHSSPTLFNVVFSGNSGGGFGGGMANTISSPTLTNVLFDHNSADMGAGIFTQDHSTPVLTNVTFSRNTAKDGGGAMVNFNFTSPTITNAIVWGNSPAFNQVSNGYGCFPRFFNSDIQTSAGSGTGWVSTLGVDGGSNLDLDPLFISPASGDFRLLTTSPAIDAGKNTVISTTTDLAGWPRFVDITTIADTGLGTAPLVDMGAYEGNVTRLIMTLVVRKSP